MSRKEYEVYFNINGLKGSAYESIRGLEKAMESEFVRVYKIYADMLNKEFDRLYPTYFEDTKDMEWYDKVKYNRFMADGYQRLIVNGFNEKEVSELLNFYVDPEEVVFKGYLKNEPTITIDFYLK